MGMDGRGVMNRDGDGVWEQTQKANERLHGMGWDGWDGMSRDGTGRYCIGLRWIGCNDKLCVANAPAM